MGQIKNIKLHIVTDIKYISKATSDHQPSTMSAALEADFEQGTSGASATYPQQCSALRKGGYVMIKERPCKVVEMSTSKTGKHGHAKVHMVALDIFTGKKLEDICPSTHNMDVPNVLRRDMQLLNIEGDFLSLMEEDGGQKDDIKLPEGDLGEEIQKRFDDDENLLITILKACGEECAIAVKATTN